MARRAAARGLAVVLVVVLLLSVAVAGRVAVVAVSDGSSAADLRGQARWLSTRVDAGAPEDMQRLFPEGYLFTVVLTGLAVAASSTDATRRADGDRVRELLALADSDAGTAPFDETASPPYGVFHAGWTLLLRVELARLTSTDEDLTDVRRHAAELREALDTSSSGLLEAYPGQSWPVDTVVAVAALNRANHEMYVSGQDPSTVRWVERIDAIRDPSTGLLPHRTTPSGEVLQGPRGTSQSVIQLFWPDIDPAAGGDEWRSYVDAFVVHRAGAVGVREYPTGVSGSGDVDSGPLVLGLSASATVVTLGAARRHGDVGLARDLDREAEVAGVPVEWGGQRRYAGGVVPVGDAFLAFARAQRTGLDTVDVGAPRVRWWVFVVWPLLPGVGSVVLLRLLVVRRRQRLSAAPPRTAAAAPPTRR